jgi:hypothetical protein
MLTIQFNAISFYFYLSLISKILNNLAERLAPLLYVTLTSICGLMCKGEVSILISWDTKDLSSSHIT